MAERPAQNDNTPPRLVKIFDRAATPLAEIALAVIDVQEIYCDPGMPRGTQQTLQTANDIASIAPLFREAGVDLYVFYFGYSGGGFDPFKFVPDVQRDVIMEKHEDSALTSDVIVYGPEKQSPEKDYFKNILERDGKSVLLTCGFNLSACVKKTALDAKNKHNLETVILSDLTADGEGSSDTLTKRTRNSLYYNGVHFAESGPILNEIQAAGGSPSSPPALAA